MRAEQGLELAAAWVQRVHRHPSPCHEDRLKAEKGLHLETSGPSHLGPCAFQDTLNGHPSGHQKYLHMIQCNKHYQLMTSLCWAIAAA